MAQLAKLPQDAVFYTQITMEAAEDVAFLEDMRKANIKGALVGSRRILLRRSRPRLIWRSEPMSRGGPRR